MVLFVVRHSSQRDQAEHCCCSLISTCNSGIDLATKPEIKNHEVRHNITINQGDIVMIYFALLLTWNCNTNTCSKSRQCKTHVVVVQVGLALHKDY